MIGIRINRQHWLDLFSDTKLDITLTSPVFSDKFVEENSVYNFQVPNNARNAGAFDFVGRIQVKDEANTKRDIEIFWKNKMVASGTVLVRNTDSKRIELVAALNDSSFYNRHGSKKITDFVYGGVRKFYHASDEVRENMIVNVAGKSQAESDWAYFPVCNPALFSAVAGTKMEDVYLNAGSFTFYAIELNRGYQNDYIDTDYINHDTFRPNRYSITPFPYLGFIVQSIFEECGYRVKQNDLTKIENLARICIYNPNITPVIQESMNDYYCNIRLNEHLPDMTVAELLQAIKMPLTLYYYIDENTKSVEIKHFDDKNDYRDVFEYDDISTDFKELNSILYKVKVDGGDDYNKTYQKPDDIENANNRGTVNLISDLAGITDKVLGDVALVLEDNYFYQYRQTDEAVFVWEKFAFNTQNVKLWDFEDVTEITTSYSTVYSEKRTVKVLDGPNPNEDWIDELWCTPRVDIPGNFRLSGIAPAIPYNDFELKLMLNWGMDSTETLNISYPAGSSSGIKEANINPVERNFSLIPSHPYSFIDEYRANYHETIKNKVVKKIYRKMSIAELQSVNFLQTALIDGRLWLPNVVRFQLSTKNVSMVEIEYIRINV